MDSRYIPSRHDGGAGTLKEMTLIIALPNARQKPGMMAEMLALAPQFGQILRAIIILYAIQVVNYFARQSWVVRMRRIPDHVRAENMTAMVVGPFMALGRRHPNENITVGSPNFPTLPVGMLRTNKAPSRPLVGQLEQGGSDLRSDLRPLGWIPVSEFGNSHLPLRLLRMMPRSLVPTGQAAESSRPVMAAGKVLPASLANGFFKHSAIIAPHVD